jgi:hypothetical protein
MRPPWPPGTSGNPAGGSKAQRDRAFLLGEVAAEDVDGSIGRRIVGALSGETIARIILARALAGDWHFLKLILMWEDNYCSDDVDDAATEPEPDVSMIDPAVIERMIAAAAQFDDDDPARPAAVAASPPADRTEPSTPAHALGREKPPDVSRADWYRSRRGR